MCLYVFIVYMGLGGSREMKYVTEDSLSQLEERKCVFFIYNSFSIKPQKC